MQNRRYACRRSIGSIISFEFRHLLACLEQNGANESALLRPLQTTAPRPSQPPLFLRRRRASRPPPHRQQMRRAPPPLKQPAFSRSPRCSPFRKCRAADGRTLIIRAFRQAAARACRRTTSHNLFLGVQKCFAISFAALPNDAADWRKSRRRRYTTSIEIALFYFWIVKLFLNTAFIKFLSPHENTVDTQACKPTIVLFFLAGAFYWLLAATCCLNEICKLAPHANNFLLDSLSRSSRILVNR